MDVIAPRQSRAGAPPSPLSECLSKNKETLLRYT